jgi:ABC-2 type transport system ATP-binding protein
MNNNVIVKTESLTRKFGNFVAVNQVNMEIYQGEIFGFLGANGAGKTTVIRMLCGLLKPSGGTGVVAGLDIYKQSEKIKENIGYMSQRFSLYNDLTIEENIEFYGGIYGLTSREIEQKTRETLVRLKLMRWAKSKTGDLPPGFKQGLALGTAMLHNPPIIFLDEPTSGVDPASRRNFWDLIHQTAMQGTTVFVTTHFMDEAEYCHRISIMDAGSIIALDTPGNLKQKYDRDNMEKVFLDLLSDDHQDSLNS